MRQILTEGLNIFRLFFLSDSSFELRAVLQLRLASTNSSVCWNAQRIFRKNSSTAGKTRKCTSAACQRWEPSSKLPSKTTGSIQKLLRFQDSGKLKQCIRIIGKLLKSRHLWIADTSGLQNLRAIQRSVRFSEVMLHKWMRVLDWKRFLLFRKFHYWSVFL